MELDALVIKYQNTRDDYIFSEIYRKVSTYYSSLLDSLSRRYGVDTLDLESLINEKIYDLALTFESRGKFLNAVITAVNFGCIDLARKRETEEQYVTDVMLYDDDEEGYVEVYEALQVAPTTDQDDIVNECIKKHDQRQLIVYLLAKADDPTKDTISAFASTDTFRQAAKLVGTCHKTVSARIRRLSRRFDESVFGNYRDYFTTPTTLVS